MTGRDFRRKIRCVGVRDNDDFDVAFVPINGDFIFVFVFSADFENDNVGFVT